MQNYLLPKLLMAKEKNIQQYEEQLIGMARWLIWRSLITRSGAHYRAAVKCKMHQVLVDAAPSALQRDSDVHIYHARLLIVAIAVVVQI